MVVSSLVAIGVARLGGASTWIGRVGDDGFGERVIRELRAEGVGVRAVLDEGAATGLMVKERVTAQSVRVHYRRTGSAGSRLCPDDVDASEIVCAGVLHVTGITPALSESAAHAVRHAIDIARGAAVPVSVDVNHRASLWPHPARAVAAYRDLLATATVVFAGPDEAALIVGAADHATMARRLADLGPSQVLLKRGGEGCLALVDGVVHEVAALPIDPFDTVGAGDAFAAGYLAELLEGAPLETRLGTAARCGAFACLGPGDWESLPRRRDLALLDGEPVIR